MVSINYDVYRIYARSWQVLKYGSNTVVIKCIATIPFKIDPEKIQEKMQ